MDVVYNHVYQADEVSFEQIVLVSPLAMRRVSNQPPRNDVVLHGKTLHQARTMGSLRL